MSASRNLGAARARGRYITFLDADDVLRPHAIATLCAGLEKAPAAAMVYGPVEYWYDWPGNPAPSRPNFVQRLGVPSGTPLLPPSLLIRFLRRDAAAPSGILVQADVFHEIGGFETRFRGMYEDQAFCAKLCLAHAVLAIDESVYRYRQHGGSSSTAADRSGEPDFGRAGFLMWLDEYFAMSPADPRVRRTLRSELRWLRFPRLHHVMRRARRSFRRFAGS